MLKTRCLNDNTVHLHIELFVLRLCMKAILYFPRMSSGTVTDEIVLDGTRGYISIQHSSVSWGSPVQSN